MDKTQLRKEMKARKRAMTEADIRLRSQRLCEKFLQSEAYRNAKTIYGYLPYNQEVLTWDALRQAIQDGKNVAVPKVYGQDMNFIYITDFSQIDTGYCGIPEPIADTPVADDMVAIGEIGLTGEIRSVSHMNQRLSEAARLGFKKCIIPRSGSEKVEIPSGLTIYRVRNLREAIETAL